MEVVELPGYLLEEKIEIAKRHLVPKQVQGTWTEKAARIDFQPEVIQKIIEDL